MLKYNLIESDFFFPFGILRELSAITSTTGADRIVVPLCSGFPRDTERCKETARFLFMSGSRGDLET